MQPLCSGVVSFIGNPVYKDHCNGFSLLSPNPGGEAPGRCVPKDGNGCQEAETGLRGEWRSGGAMMAGNAPIRLILSSSHPDISYSVKSWIATHTQQITAADSDQC